MEVHILCDRCFKDVVEGKKFYKVGSCNYCPICYEKIERTLEVEYILQMRKNNLKNNLLVKEA